VVSFLLKGGQVGYASDGHFNTTFVYRGKNESWRRSVFENGWVRINLVWYTTFAPKNCLVVRYENLVNNTEKELRRMVKFLNVSVTDDIMDCVMRNNVGKFKRKKKKLDFDPFTEEMKQVLNKRKEYVYNVLNAGDVDSDYAIKLF